MPKYDDPDYMKKWREANQDKIKASRRAYYERNKETEKAQATAWQKANPERQTLIYKAVSANRRYPGTLTADDIALVIERSGRTCHYCGKSELTGRECTLEHLRPINQIEYLTIACNACNAAKPTRNGGQRLTLDDIRVRRAAAKKKYFDENKEHLLQKRKEWIDRNLEKYRTYHREYKRRMRAKKDTTP